MISDDKIMDLVLRDQFEGEDYYESFIRPKVEEWSQIYNGDQEYYKKLMPVLSKKSSFVSTDVSDTIEFVMPDMMKIFYGGADVISIQGRTSEDVEPAKINQDLANYQLNVLNNGYMLFYTWFKDALRFGLGVVKGSWRKEYGEVKETITVNEQQLQQLMLSDIYRIEKTEPITLGVNVGMYNVTVVREKLKFNAPVFENIPISELIYDPKATSIKNARYVIHRKTVNADYLRKNKDIFNNVEEAIEKGGLVDLEKYSSLRADGYDGNTYTNQEDTPRKEFTIYEAYTSIDINDDGLLEDVIITYVGDVILSVQENTYKEYPFFVLSALPEPYQVLGRAWASMVGNIQNIKTALFRQLLVNVALSNEQRKYVDENTIRFEDIIENREFVRVSGDPSRAVQFENPIPIHQATPLLLQYLDSAREQKIGVNQVKMGVDHKVLNHALETATGARQLFEASNARINLIARTFAETGVKDMFMFLVSANQKFIDAEQVVRLTNKTLEIRPDDLQGNFDFIVAGGIGSGMTEMKLQNLQTLLGISTNALLNIGISNPSKIRNLVEAIINEMGFKDGNKFIMTEDEIEQQQQQSQMQMQQQQSQMQMQQQQSQMQMQQQPAPPPEQLKMMLAQLGRKQ